MELKDMVKVVEIVNDNFGGEEFTNKDWEAIRQMFVDARQWDDCPPTINTLRKNGLVVVARVEEFELRKPNRYADEKPYVIDKRGEAVMTLNEYNATSSKVREVLRNSLNDGQEFTIESRTEMEVINAHRNYYKLNLNALANKKQALIEQINALLANKAELEQEIASLSACVSSVDTDENCIGIGIGIISL